jgi:CRISPR-associated protein Csh2
LGFNGTINAYAAKTTGLTNEDVEVFRNAIWESIPASPTRSKLNQYPKVYLEIIYNEGISNGQFGDLRNLVDIKPTNGMPSKKVRRVSDLDLNFDNLIKLLNQNKGEGKKVKDVIVKTSPEINISL